jgi:hypothetical protein
MDESVGETTGGSGDLPRGAVRVARRRAAGPRPVRPAAAVQASRPAQPARPASRTAPVAVVVPLFGEPGRERVLGRSVVESPQRPPASRELPRGSVREAMRAAGWEPVRHERGVAPVAGPLRRFLAGLALLVAVAVTVVLLGLVAALAGEARGGAESGGGPGATIMVSPEGAAVTR